MTTHGVARGWCNDVIYTVAAAFEDSGARERAVRGSMQDEALNRGSKRRAASLGHGLPLPSQSLESSGSWCAYGSSLVLRRVLSADS